LIRVEIDKSVMQRLSKEWKKKLEYELDSIAYDVGREIIDRAIKNLEEDNAIATGYLKNSAFVELLGEGSVRVGFSAPYAIFVEYGTNEYTAPPPINKIEEWVKAKFGYDGRKAHSIAYTISREIFERGTEPRWFFKNALYSVLFELDRAGAQVEGISRGEYYVVAKEEHKSLWRRILDKIKRVFRW